MKVKSKKRKNNIIFFILDILFNLFLLTLLIFPIYLLKNNLINSLLFICIYLNAFLLLSIKFIYFLKNFKINKKNGSDLVFYIKGIFLIIITILFFFFFIVLLIMRCL